MKIIAFITGAVAISKILNHLGEPTSPPLWEIQGSEFGESDPQAQPATDYKFDQRVAW